MCLRFVKNSPIRAKKVRPAGIKEMTTEMLLSMKLYGGLTKLSIEATTEQKIETETKQTWRTPDRQHILLSSK